MLILLALSFFLLFFIVIPFTNFNCTEAILFSFCHKPFHKFCVAWLYLPPLQVGLSNHTNNTGGVQVDGLGAEQAAQRAGQQLYQRLERRKEGRIYFR